MAHIIYTLCFLTALLCAALLTRSYLRHRHRLLFWSALCFVGLSVNNLLLVLDRIAFPDVNLSMWRLVTALVATCLLLFGLIWEHE
jgi:hypothetical protein